MNWINVNDRLPTRNGFYDTKVKSLKIKFPRKPLERSYYKNGRFVVESNKQITHWLEK